VPAEIYYAAGIRDAGMLKRFMIGFVVGIGAMYWYIHHAADTMADADQWMRRSASAYRDDRVHKAVEQETGGTNR
jgi:hypothetical protein